MTRGRQAPCDQRGRPWLVGGSVFLVSLGVYAATFSRTVQWGDSGELTAAAYVLGVPHAPGYPLLMLLAKLACYLPLGSVAQSLNLLNAVFAAGTASLTAVIALRVGCRWLGAALAGLALSFSPIFWSQAVAFEVYCFATFMLTLLLLLALKWSEDRKRGTLFLFALLYGLGTSAHLLLAAFAPAFAAFFWLNWQRRARVRQAASAAGGGRSPTPADPSALAVTLPPDRGPSLLSSLALVVAGLLLGVSIWLYLPLRAIAHPPIDFAQASTWHNFLRTVMGGTGRANLFRRTLGDNPPILFEFLLIAARAFYWPGVLLAALGAFRLLVRHREVFAATAIILVTDVIFAANFWVWDVEVFLIPSHLVLALWLGFGADWFLAFVGSRKVAIGRRLWSYASKRAAYWGVGALLLFLPCAQLWDNWPAADLSEDCEALDFAHAFLDSVEPNALLVTDWWYVGPLFYAHFVEGRRPDVDVIPQLSKANPNETLALFSEDNLKSRPVYVGEQLTHVVKRIQDRFLLLPMGGIGKRAYRVLEKDSPLPPGNELPSVKLKRKVASGCELVGFDLPSAAVRQGGAARLICHWRVTGGSPAPSALVVLDAVGKAERIWRDRSTLLPLASQRVAPGQQLLFQEEFIAWLPSDAPPGSYRFAIQVNMEPGQATSSISADELTIRVLPRQNGE